MITDRSASLNFSQAVDSLQSKLKKLSIEGAIGRSSEAYTREPSLAVNYENSTNYFSYQNIFYKQIKPIIEDSTEKLKEIANVISKTHEDLLMTKNLHFSGEINILIEKHLDTMEHLLNTTNSFGHSIFSGDAYDKKAVDFSTLGVPDLDVADFEYYTGSDNDMQFHDQAHGVFTTTKANDSNIEMSIRCMRKLQTMNFDNLSITDKENIDRICDLLRDTVDRFEHIHAANASQLKTIDEQIELNNANQAHITERMDDIEEVNQVEAITALMETQQTIQSIYMLYAKIRDLKLINYIK